MISLQQSGPMLPVAMQQNETKLEWWFELQMLRQENEMNCGVCVFGTLTNLTRQEILFDMPDAVERIGATDLLATLCIALHTCRRLAAQWSWGRRSPSVKQVCARVLGLRPSAGNRDRSSGAFLFGS
jgi:hypothetical protein